MTLRRSSVLAVVALALFAPACSSPLRPGGPSDRTGTSGPTTTYGPISPPPAQVLDASVVFFDPDGTDRQGAEPSPPVITDVRALDAFARRYVDGDPQLGWSARAALDQGKVLVGGAVSSGCFPAEGARLAFTAAEILIFPIGLPPDDPELACVRAITSIALMAIDPAELPGLLPVRGI